MDSQGRVYRLPLEALLMGSRRAKNLTPIMRELTEEEKNSGKIGFNAPCTCGSGKKFKRCCFGRRPEDRLASVRRHQQR
jgi:hypothetical protein